MTPLGWQEALDGWNAALASVPVGGPECHRWAVVDCGTNTFNLLVRDVRTSELVWSTKLPVKLGLGGLTNGRLAPEALERGVHALKLFRAAAQHLGVERLWAFATSGVRSTQMPDIPTFREQGIEGFDVTGWYGLCTQAKVPSEIITRINTDVNRMLGTGQALRKRLEDQGIDIAPATPAEFAAMVRQEIAKWTKVVRETKLEGD